MNKQWATEPVMAFRTPVRRGAVDWSRPLVLLVAASAYWLVQFVIYVVWIAPRYGFLAMGWGHPDPLAVAICFALAVLTALALPRSIASPATLITWAFWAAVIVPASYIPHVSGHLGPLASVGVTVMAAVALLIMAGIAGRVRRLRIPQPPFGWPLAVTVLLVAAVALNLYIFWWVGYRFSLLGVGDAFNARLAFRQQRESLPTFVGYAIPWASVAVNPLVLAIGLYRRWYLRVGVPVALATVGLYAIDGQKLVLFTPLFVVAVFLIFNLRGRITPWAAMGGLAAVNAVAAVLAPVADGMILETVVRRIQMIPGQLVGGYVEFYSQNPFTYLQQSRFFNSGTLAEEPSYVIGRFLFQSTTQNANANFMGDGYASLGVAGVLLFAVVAGCVLGLIDSLSARHKPSLAIAAAASLAITLTNSPLQTALLTGGVALFCVLLALLPAHDPSPELARVAAARARHRAPILVAATR